MRLGRRGLRRALLPVLPVLGTARPLGGRGPFATVHLAIAVGVAAAIGVLAVVLSRAGGAVLRVLAVALMLRVGAVPVMLGVAAILRRAMLGVALVALLSGLRGLSGGWSRHGKRQSGDEKRLHCHELLSRLIVDRVALRRFRRIAEEEAPTPD